MKKVLTLVIISLGLVQICCGCALKAPGVTSQEKPTLSPVRQPSDDKSPLTTHEYEYCERDRERIEYDRLLIAEDKARDVFVYKRYPKDRLLSYVNEKDDSLGLEVVINQHVIYHPELDCFEAEVAVRKWKQKEIAVIAYSTRSGQTSWEFLLIHDMKTMSELPVPSYNEVYALYDQVEIDEYHNRLDMSAFDPTLITPDFDYSVAPRGEDISVDVLHYWINDNEDLVVFCCYNWPADGIYFVYQYDGETFILTQIKSNIQSD